MMRYSDRDNVKNAEKIYLNKKGLPNMIAKDKKTGKVIYVEWLNEGKYHRDNGPAIFYWSDNIKAIEWYNEGIIHRLDGPAKFCSLDNTKWGELYAIGGTFFKKENYERIVDLIKNKQYDDLATVLANEFVVKNVHLLALEKFAKLNNDNELFGVVDGEVLIRVL